MKQTAVEWLVSRLKIIEAIDIKDIKQAKEMEKEQIIDARLHGFKSSGEGWNGEYPFEGKDNFYISNEINNEQYYNETFKSE